MITPRRIYHGLSLALVVALTTAPAARAQILPALDPATVAEWRAVGVLNREGPGGTANCTATLVAPDLVLTAAHCAKGPPERRRFVIGGIGAQALATRAVAAIDLHPNYGELAGYAKFQVDLALVTLAAPVPPDLAMPLPVSVRPAAQSYGIVAFHRLRPGALNGRFDCPRDPPGPANRFLLGCQVISGNSGSPALARTPAGWTVVGVVVATVRHPTRPQALVAPIDAWLLSKLAAHGVAGGVD